MMIPDIPRSHLLRGALLHSEPLARYTTWRCGGPADRVYKPVDREDLANFVAQLPAQEPLTVIGLGSNLLVRDGGVRGTVIVLHPVPAALEMHDGLVYAEAGVASPKVARFAALQGLEGAEFLAGIPGTVGGALAMNAGCYGGETWRHVAAVEVLTRGGRYERRNSDAYAIGYRSVRRADATAHGRALDHVFTAAWLQFPRGEGDVARERIRTLLKRRIATQPLELPNAGSVFRNPEGDHAARLIEACGLKGFAIGAVQVSRKHANFIVNPKGLGTAAEIEALIGHVYATVLARTGVALETEVRIIGETIAEGRNAP